jgi:CubicO group peptidase (beta-lactamase class C family)
MLATKAMRVLTVFLAWVLLLEQGWGAAGTVPTSTELNIEGVEAYIEEQMRRHRLPGVAVAITQGEEITYLGGFGSDGRGQHVTPQTPFYIGSISKSFTALAVMQLVDAGKVELDAPVQQYAPWFTVAEPDASRAITVRYLLHQISGMSASEYRQPLFDPEATMEEAIRHLSGVELAAPPGTAFHYFNPNYTLLGLIIEEVTGQSYADYIHGHVFNPLGMTRSFTALDPAEAAGLASGHNLFFGAPIRRRQPFFTYDLPAGFIISTAEDMAHYLIAQNNDGRYNRTNVISPEAVTTMHTAPDDLQSNYAMGWNVAPREDMTVIRHNGALDSFYADAILLPEQEIGIVLLVNLNGLLPLAVGYQPLADGLVDVLLGREPVAGPSMQLLYALVNLVVIADLVRHGVVMSRLSNWDERGRDQRKARQILDVTWQHFLMALLLIAPIVLIIGSAGLDAARVTWLYLMPDVGLWLIASAILFLVEGGIKLTRIVGMERRSDAAH